MPKGIPTAPPRGFSCIRGASVSLIRKAMADERARGLLRTLHLSALRGVPPRPLWAVRAPSRVLRKISKRGYCVCFPFERKMVSVCSVCSVCCFPFERNCPCAVPCVLCLVCLVYVCAVPCVCAVCGRFQALDRAPRYSAPLRYRLR